MKFKAKDLLFISRIKPDGLGLIPIDLDSQNVIWAMNEEYRLERLSITQDTWIAFNMSVYVVKIKKP